jgi:hypothetical protein
MFRFQILLHPAVGVVDAAVELELLRALLERFDGNLLQERNRVVIELSPADRIELAEERRRIVVPAPPQIPGERVEPLVRRSVRASAPR